MRLSIYLSTCLSIYLYIHLSISIPIYRPIYQSINTRTQGPARIPFGGVSTIESTYSNTYLYVSLRTSLHMHRYLRKLPTRNRKTVGADATQVVLRMYTHIHTYKGRTFPQINGRTRALSSPATRPAACTHSRVLSLGPGRRHVNTGDNGPAQPRPRPRGRLHASCRLGGRLRAVASVLSGHFLRETERS